MQSGATTSDVQEFTLPSRCDKSSDAAKAEVCYAEHDRSMPLVLLYSIATDGSMQFGLYALEFWFGKGTGILCNNILPIGCNQGSDAAKAQVCYVEQDRSMSAFHSALLDRD